MTRFLSHNTLALIFSMWGIKVFIEIVGLPISIPLSKKLKNLEKIDIYDDATKFNIFSLDADYKVQANHFQ